MNTSTGRLALATAAVLVLTAAGIGVAAAAAPPAATDPLEPAALEMPLPASDQDAGAIDAPRLRKLLGARMVHAEVIVDRGDKGLVTIQADRGTIKAIGAQSLTIAQAGNRTETVATTELTRVRKDRQKATLADLEVGDRVLVLSQLKGGKAEAYLVVVPAARPALPAAAATPAP